MELELKFVQNIYKKKRWIYNYIYAPIAIILSLYVMSLVFVFFSKLISLWASTIISLIVYCLFLFLAGLISDNIVYINVARHIIKFTNILNQINKNFNSRKKAYTYLKNLEIVKPFYFHGSKKELLDYYNKMVAKLKIAIIFKEREEIKKLKPYLESIAKSLESYNYEDFRKEIIKLDNKLNLLIINLKQHAEEKKIKRGEIVNLFLIILGIITLVINIIYSLI